jgi:hypothetical protein
VYLDLDLDLDLVQSNSGEPLLNVAVFPFMLLAALGFVLSVAAHLLAITGIQIPGGGLVWGLHVGIFAVWIPAVLVSVQTARLGNRKDFWKIALAGCPPWMRYGLFVLFGYAIFNFILFISVAPAHTQQFGNTPPPSVLRGFSGHWMIFYAAAFAILYCRIHAPQLYKVRKCPNGHVVSPAARFCPDCGCAVPNAVGFT